MKTPLKTKREILDQITSLDLLLKGKITPKRTPDGKTNGHKLQRWHNGKNHSIHVPDERLELFTEATENYQRFTQLVDEYVTCCEEEVLRPGDDSKKKHTRR